MSFYGPRLHFRQCPARRTDKARTPRIGWLAYGRRLARDLRAAPRTRPTGPPPLSLPPLAQQGRLRRVREHVDARPYFGGRPSVQVRLWARMGVPGADVRVRGVKLFPVLD